MGDANGPAAPLARVSARRGGRDVAVVIVLLVGALLVGVSLGFRLASQGNQTAVLPLATAEASRAPTPSPAPVATPEPTFPPYPVQLGVVTDELRDAYYRGAAGISVCVGSTAIVCHGGLAFVAVEPVGDEITAAQFESLFSGAPLVQLKPDSTFVVEDLGNRYVEGVLFNEGTVQFGQPVTAVNANGAGIFFMSLGGIDLGRSVLVVRSIPLARPLRPDQSLRWEANVIALEMTR